MSARSTRPSRDGIGPIACRSCDLNEVCRLSGLIAFEGGRARHSTGALRTVRAGTPLFRAGDPAQSVYAIRQGLLKTVHVNSDGDEHISAVNAPGEVIGLEAFSTGTYACDVIALQTSVCCELPIRPLAEHGARVGELGSALVRVLSAALIPRPALTRGSIRSRVITLLLDLSTRLQRRGLDGRQISLGLSRQEIADLLDVRIETVSRIMQRLHRERAIHVSGNKVSLLDLKA